MSGETVCIVQARMGSTRLPGKILKDLLGKPMLERQIERLRAGRLIGKIVLATTRSTQDRPLLDLAAKWGLEGYAGSEEDVLDRYYQAAKIQKAEVVVRSTADCPLIDPEIVDRTIALYLQGALDYASTGNSYPDGLDTEVFSFAALETAWKEARLASEREHVTPFIWKNPGRFRSAALPAAEDLSGLRWTVDEPRDFSFVEEVYKRLYRKDGIFLMKDVLDLLAKEPGLAEINQGIMRNEGYAKSLTNDREMRTNP